MRKKPIFKSSISDMVEKTSKKKVYLMILFILKKF